jgi:hypothetical protein
VGSVYATWTGQCRDAVAREELCLRMTDLGELSHSFFKPLSPLIKQFNQTIKGNILVSEHLFPAPPSSPKLARVSESFFSLQKVSLVGVEFQLYDSRRMYAGQDRMSFVFCVDDDPQIDGIMVYAEERGECLKYTDELIRQADYLLEVPNIHLRYYLEDWMDSLFGWVKYHYVENLRYWRYEDKWSDRATLAGYFEQFGRYEYYETLKTRLASEVALYAGKDEISSQFRNTTRGHELMEDFDES